MEPARGRYISSKIRLLVVNDPGEAKNPAASERALNEIAVMMNKNWEIHSLHSRTIQHRKSPCNHVIHTVGWRAWQDSVLLKFIYLLFSVVKGVRIVKRYNIHLVLAISGHIHLGLVVHLISKITRRKSLVRVDCDVVTDLLFFLQRTKTPVLTSKLCLRNLQKFLRIFERVLFKHLDWIVTHGPMDYEKIRTMTKRVSFVPLWIDTEKFSPLSEYNKKILKKKLIGNTEGKVVLYVGRLHPEKKVSTLIQAFKKVSEKLDNTFLLIVGCGPEEDNLKALVCKLDIEDKVNFLGYIHNDYMPRYYQIADVYILCSLREELSNTIMEAMASGVPVIASNVPSNPFLVENGETGFLVSSREPAQLAEKVLYVLENFKDITSIVSKARKLIGEYDKTRIGSLYKTLIFNLIQGAPPPNDMLHKLEPQLEESKVRKKKVLFISGGETITMLFLEVIKELEDSKYDIRVINRDYYFNENSREILKDQGIATKGLEIYGTRNIRKMLELEKPNVIILGHDGAPIERSFVLASSLLEMPTLLIQDGIIDLPQIFSTKEFMPRFVRVLPHLLRKRKNILTSYTFLIRTSGIIKFLETVIAWYKKSHDYGRGECSKVAVMGPYAKCVFVKLGFDADNVSITGQPRFDRLFHPKFTKYEVYNNIGLDYNKDIALLAPPTFTDPEKRRRFVEAVAKALTSFNNFALVIKVHPGENSEHYKKILKEIPHNNGYIIEDFDIPSLLNACKIFISEHSTMALEALIAQKPVIILNLFNNREYYPFVASGAALGVHKTEDLTRTIHAILHDEKIKAKLESNRDTFVYEHAFFSDGKASKRVANLIQQMCKDPSHNHNSP